ncbi:hypothetical protein B0T16DRAFT_518561, partial [Cercophora newfieldiana]
MTPSNRHHQCRCLFQRCRWKWPSLACTFGIRYRAATSFLCRRLGHPRGPTVAGFRVSTCLAMWRQAPSPDRVHPQESPFRRPVPRMSTIAASSQSISGEAETTAIKAPSLNLATQSSFPGLPWLSSPAGLLSFRMRRTNPTARYPWRKAELFRPSWCPTSRRLAETAEGEKSRYSQKQKPGPVSETDVVGLQCDGSVPKCTGCIQKSLGCGGYDTITRIPRKVHQHQPWSSSE